MKNALSFTILVAVLAGCGGGGTTPDVAVVDGPGTSSFKGEVWADNWFAFYVGDRLIIEDSVPITTERSFNAEAFVFNADYPLQLNFVAKDFKQDDTGLEYIGRGNQQMGDGGLIAQFTDAATGGPVAVTDSAWRCLVIHEAPLDRACEDEADPEPGVGPCQFTATAEPEGWREPGFDDSEWPSAVEHSAAAVRPKGGYDAIDWWNDARLIWSADLETHNTLLCRLTVEQPPVAIRALRDRQR
ncbi:MAG: PEBP family protein [Holophagales bacterium]|nr:PEBP family protein [Holophagales bacterium]